LSGRYSSSPALRLTVGKSRLRAILYGALCVATCYALWAICARGYGVLSVLSMPLAAWMLWRLRSDRAAGVLLCWQGGVWTLEQAGERSVIALLPRCTATRWAIYLVFNDVSAGCIGRLWLFADSAPQFQMRQLRVRLTLMH
jgi:hypothetical protein